MGILVRALQTVFYGGVRVRAGKTFTITDPSHFSERYMEQVHEPGARDDIAAAIESSPKQRGSSGVELKPKRTAPGAAPHKGALDPDPGI